MANTLSSMLNHLSRMTEQLNYLEYEFKRIVSNKELPKKQIGKLKPICKTVIIKAIVHEIYNSRQTTHSPTTIIHESSALNILHENVVCIKHFLSEVPQKIDCTKMEKRRSKNYSFFMIFKKSQVYRILFL